MEQKTLTEKRFFKWEEDDISVTLRERSASYGGGSEVLVICYTKTPLGQSVLETTKVSGTNM
jgi:hypothetical protein